MAHVTSKFMRFYEDIVEWAMRIHSVQYLPISIRLSSMSAVGRGRI
jgi:hypothetical protein